MSSALTCRGPFRVAETSAAAAVPPPPPPTMNDAELGVLVTRGPDWHWGDQDGGEGGLGVIVGWQRWRGERDRNRIGVRVFWERTREVSTEPSDTPVTLTLATPAQSLLPAPSSVPRRIGQRVSMGRRTGYRRAEGRPTHAGGRGVAAPRAGAGCSPQCGGRGGTPTTLLVRRDAN